MANVQAMGDLDTAIRRLTGAIERLEALLPDLQSALDRNHQTSSSHASLRAEVSAVIAELDQLIDGKEG